MRRALATLFGTVAVLVALLNFKTEPRPLRVRPAAIAPTVATPGTASPEAPSSAPASGVVSPASPPTPTDHSSSEPAVPAVPAQPSPRVVTGQAVQTDYGPVQVQITMTGTAINDITALQLPQDRRRSAQISESAAPVLRQEALTAQSAHIDTVSGATYTSDGYAQSLQSALDLAHVG